MPSVGENGTTEEPARYFSPGSPNYSIVGAPEGAGSPELDYPDDTADRRQVSTTFTVAASVGNTWNSSCTRSSSAPPTCSSSQTNEEL